MSRLLIFIKYAPHLSEGLAACPLVPDAAEMLFEMGDKVGIIILPIRPAQLFHVHAACLDALRLRSRLKLLQPPRTRRATGALLLLQKG